MTGPGKICAYNWVFRPQTLSFQVLLPKVLFPQTDLKPRRPVILYLNIALWGQLAASLLAKMSRLDPSGAVIRKIPVLCPLPSCPASAPPLPSPPQNTQPTLDLKAKIK